MYILINIAAPASLMHLKATKTTVVITAAAVVRDLAGLERKASPSVGCRRNDTKVTCVRFSGTRTSLTSDEEFANEGDVFGHRHQRLDQAGGNIRQAKEWLDVVAVADADAGR